MKDLGSSSKKGAESSWYVIGRCFVLLNRLQQGPAALSELVQIQKDFADGPVDRSALVKRWHNDKTRLKKIGIHIKFDQTKKVYVIFESALPLLNLSDSHLETLAFLNQSFSQNTPRDTAVNQLLNQLFEWLPEARQIFYTKALRQQMLEANLMLRDQEPIAPDVHRLIEEAFLQRRVVSFDYLSRNNQNKSPLEHRVQPWKIRVNKARRHLELWGYCEWQSTTVSETGWNYRNYRRYRLSRIVSGSVHILPKKLPYSPPIGKPEKVVYELHPDLMIGGLSTQDELIESPSLVELKSGWWRIEGRTYDVFSLARSLLFYGSKCKVIGAETFLRETKHVIDGINKLYNESSKT